MSEIGFSNLHWPLILGKTDFAVLSLDFCCCHLVEFAGHVSGHFSLYRHFLFLFLSPSSWFWFLIICDMIIGARFYAIWHARNAIRFQNSILSTRALLHSIRLRLHEIDFFRKGTMRNSVAELCIMRWVGIIGRPSKAPKIIEVMWHAPPIFQVKINTDGVAQALRVWRVLVTFFVIIWVVCLVVLRGL